MSQELAPAAITTLTLKGLDILAEAPVLEDQMPPVRDLSGAAIIVRLRGLESFSSTVLKWPETLLNNLQSGHNLLLLAGVESTVMRVFKKSGFSGLIGEENFFWLSRGTGRHWIRPMMPRANGCKDQIEVVNSLAKGHGSIGPSSVAGKIRIVLPHTPAKIGGSVRHISCYSNGENHLWIASQRN